MRQTHSKHDPTNSYAVAGPSNPLSSSPSTSRSSSQHPQKQLGFEVPNSHPSASAQGVVGTPSSTASSSYSSSSSFPNATNEANTTIPPAAPLMTAGSLASEQQQPPPAVRSVNGPTIIPTRTGSDGLKLVPKYFELCAVEDLITLIAYMLDRLISHNDRIPLTPTSLTRFHSRAPPSINVRDYLLRIARYTNVEPCCLLILLPYVDKVCARLPSFTISSLTVHRFVIAGVSVGSKALSDSFCTNGRYARVGGVSIAEMNLLEKEFCEAIDWRLTTTGAVLAHYYTSLVRSHPHYSLSSTPVTPLSNGSGTQSTSSPGTDISMSPSTSEPSASPSASSIVREKSSSPRRGSLSAVNNSGGITAMEDVQSTSESSAPLSSLSPSPETTTAISISPTTQRDDRTRQIRPNLSLSNGLPFSNNLWINGMEQQIGSPALIPAPATRLATASNLPSPVARSVDDPIGGGGGGGGGGGREVGEAGGLDRLSQLGGSDMESESSSMAFAKAATAAELNRSNGHGDFSPSLSKVRPGNKVRVPSNLKTSLTATTTSLAAGDLNGIQGS